MPKAAEATAPVVRRSRRLKGEAEVVDLENEK